MVLRMCRAGRWGAARHPPVDGRSGAAPAADRPSAWLCATLDQLLQLGDPKPPAPLLPLTRATPSQPRSTHRRLPESRWWDESGPKNLLTTFVTVFVLQEHKWEQESRSGKRNRKYGMLETIYFGREQDDNGRKSIIQIGNTYAHKSLQRSAIQLNIKVTNLQSYKILMQIVP